MGGWTAAGAPDSISLAQRRAIVVRVKDRERFERVIENFQGTNGSFTNVADYLAIGTRAAAALPASAFRCPVSSHCGSRQTRCGSGNELLVCWTNGMERNTDQVDRTPLDRL